jgi:hypothetical protein
MSEPRRPRISVVNDNPEFLELMSAILDEEAGYDVALFDGEETTEDAVKAWAVSNKFLQPAEDEPAPEPVSTGYTPTVIEGSPIGSKIYSFDEWLKLSEVDPAKANQRWTSNRVEGKIT